MYRGRLQPPLRIGRPIPLTRDDLEALKEPGRYEARPLARLRNSHHTMARLAAAGLRHKDIAARTGYAYNRVIMLLNSPAMIELIASYRKQIDEAFIVEASSFYELAVENMVMAERMINDQLHEADEAEELPKIRELLAISRDGADRLGYPKANTNLNVNTDFAAMLEKAIARSGKTPEALSTPAAVQLRALPGPVSPPEPAPVPPLRRRA
jgi:hypothetical protein